MANNTKTNSDRHHGVAVFARIPKELHAKLREKADSERRTIGAQLTIIIEKHFTEVGQKFPGQSATEQAMVTGFNHKNSEVAK